MSTAEQPATPPVFQAPVLQAVPQPPSASQQTSSDAAQAGDEAPRELTSQAMTTWARLREVEAQVKQLTEEAESLKATLRENLGAGEFAIGGKTVFTITPGRKWSAELAEQELTADELAACTVTVLDRAKVQELVSPARYAAMQAEAGKATVKASR